MPMTFKGLHDTIQPAFLWFDNHRWEFKVASRQYGLPLDEEFGSDQVYNANTTRLTKLRGDAVAEFLYTYDMGDNWIHHVEILSCLTCRKVRACPSSSPEKGEHLPRMW